MTYFINQTGIFNRGKSKRVVAKKFQVKAKQDIKNEVFGGDNFESSDTKTLTSKFTNRVHSKKALKKDLTQYELAHAYLQRNMYIMAVRSFRKALNSDIPEYNKMLSHYFLAKIFEKNLNDPKRALKEWIALKKMPASKNKYKINFPKRAIKEIKRLREKIR